MGLYEFCERRHLRENNRLHPPNHRPKDVSKKRRTRPGTIMTVLLKTSILMYHLLAARMDIQMLERRHMLPSEILNRFASTRHNLNKAGRKAFTQILYSHWQPLLLSSVTVRQLCSFHVYYLLPFYKYFTSLLSCSKFPYSCARRSFWKMYLLPI